MDHKKCYKGTALQCFVIHLHLEWQGYTLAIGAALVTQLRTIMCTKNSNIQGSSPYVVKP